MANLTRSAFITRQSVKYGLFAIATIVFLRTGWSMFQAYWKAKHPAPPPPPTVAFGQLPKLDFGETKPRPNKEFILETIEGGLPQLNAQAPVFFIPALQSKFLALENTNKIAQNLGFSPNPEKISNDLYRYYNQKVNITLKINALTKTFIYSYPYLQDQTLAHQFIPAQGELVERGLDFLALISQVHPDIDGAGAKITLWKIIEGKTEPAVSLSEANLAQIDFYRQPINGEYPIYPKSLDQANISLLLSGDRGAHQVVEARYTYFFVDLEKKATYPLKPPAEAWQEILDGDYHLAKFDQGVESKTIPVRRIYLAYFDPHYPTNFLQPIYVFEGDYSFTAFVPAISNEWVAE
ncbi:MAG: hypothetical protein ABIB61_03260 [Candidatus Shapirobacteria bacterium]